MNRDQENVWNTYLAMRAAMVLLVGLLFLAIIIQVFVNAPDCLQHSVSAYYYTGVRAVFVGALCAVGICLIVHRGNTDIENILLDYSGFMALVVAFVPTEIDNTCAAANVPTESELNTAVINNVAAVLSIGAVAVVLALLGKRSLARASYLRDRPTKAWAVVTLVVLLAGAAYFAFWTDEFQRMGHNVSATALFAGIFAVTVANAIGLAKEPDKGPMNRYTVVAAVMVLSAAVCLVVRAMGFGHWLLLLEALLIAEFAVFWILQTNELKGRVSRDAASRSN